MKYFVTGATGFIGGHLVYQLLAREYELITLVITPVKAQKSGTLGTKAYKPADNLPVA